ncbi:MAG: acyltransferase family protein [Terriglobia bacterium]
MPDHPPQRKTKITYRPDVDGLRAVAVLLVVFDHINTRVTGGYIGVDVFFVISGYLITSVILSDMAAGTFSVSNFYERRIRRILPALLVMLAGCAAITYFCCVPSETEVFGRSLLSALFSVSNFFFWQQSRANFVIWHHAGYFDISRTGIDTLLHTWSLAVEEQFYIIFPLFLIAVRRWCSNRLRLAIWSITILTFGLACVCVYRDPNAAFYFAPLRAWELLVGTIISQHYVPAIKGKWVRNLAATSGLLLILVPSLLYTGTTHFPGLAALPPCAGAALLIAAGETGDSLVGLLLSWRPIVFIGLISYSLYLWHWPIIIFLEENYIHLDSGSPKQFKLAVLLASLIAGTLSWLLVERPFRRGRFRPGRRALFLATGVATVLIAAIGVFMVASQGFSSRFPHEALDVDRFSKGDYGTAFRQANACFLDPRFAPFDQFNKAACLSEDPDRKHELLVGDSHAAHLYPGLRFVFPELNISEAATAGCLPLLTQPPGTAYCDGSMWKYIYSDYLIHHHVDAILIAGRWHEADFPELGRTVAWIRQQGIDVIVFGPVPEFDVPLPRLLTLSLRERNPAMIDRHRRTEPVQTDKELAELARGQWKVRYISAYEDLCAANVKTEAAAPLHTNSGCPVFAAPGVPFLFDSNHFTTEGSIFYARTMREHNQLP